MPSLMIHLLVGEKYCDNNKITDKINFLKGNFAPDLANDKKQSHFSKDGIYKTFTDAILNKIDITKLSKAKFNLTDDFEKGVFLHLLTDYYFYNKYLINDTNYKKYENGSYNYVKNLMYKDYGFVGYWIKNNFINLNYNLLPKSFNITEEGEMKIFSEELLFQIIDFCSNLNLEEIYNTLLRNGNIK